MYYFDLKQTKNRRSNRSGYIKLLRYLFNILPLEFTIDQDDFNFIFN